MSFKIHFRPKLFETIRGYSKDDFRGDLIGGITVGIVALPLAMAFGIASGATPESGLFTAVIAGFIISALGGSRVQIGGPTGAFIVIIFAIIAEHGFANLLICTLMAGVMLLLMGLFRLGSVIKYVPYPVIAGFTSGIAVMIFVTQIPDFLGLTLDELPGSFFNLMKVLARCIGAFHWQAVVVAAVSVIRICRWPKRWAEKVPSTIAALVIGTVVVTFFNIPMETIGSRFGGIPQGFPKFEIPEITVAHLGTLFQPALAIALLGAIESLLSAAVADGMIGDRHDSNQELMVQGLANILVPFFGGIPATGAIARTATNVKNGGKTPIAGMIHAVVLLIIILVAGPLVKYVPLASLS